MYFLLFSEFVRPAEALQLESLEDFEARDLLLSFANN